MMAGAEDRPPVVLAAATKSLHAGGFLQFSITASDPDGDALTGLVAEGIPGAQFVRNLDNTVGWFTWTPTVSDVGTHTLQFTASNALQGSATTTIEVLPPGQPPIASLVASPDSGLTPLTVTLDASGSVDPDGTIASYHFFFGDGLSIQQASPVIVRTYNPGIYTATVRVIDSDRDVGTATTTVSVYRLPVAEFSLDRTTGEAPFTVGMYANAHDPDGQRLASFRWDFGDGSSETNGFEVTHHTFQEGTWTITLTVTDMRGVTASKSRVVTVAPQNFPADLVGPNFVVGKAGEPMVIHVSVTDREGDPITLVTYGAPTASRFVAAPDGSSDVFSWTPTVADVGSRRFYFDAQTRGSSYFYPVIVSVWSTEPSPNLAPNPSVETNAVGWGPYAEAVLERVSGGYQGDFAIRVTGPPEMSGSFGVNDTPDVIRYTLSAGLHYRYTAWVRSDASRGTARLRVREYRMGTGEKLGEAVSAGVLLSPQWQKLTMVYATKSDWSTLDFQIRDYPVAPSEVFLADGIAIQNVTGEPGAGVVDVDLEPTETVELRPMVAPSPVRGSGSLSFTMKRRGPLRVQILDLSGRRVKTLLDEADAAPGAYRLPLAPNDASPLRAGVYFFRLTAGDLIRTGRFVVLQ
jgi:PKD repeat protein